MIYVHQFNRIRDGKFDKLWEAVQETGLPVAEQLGVRLLGYWETVPTSGPWPEAVAVWEYDDFGHYIKVTEALHSAGREPAAKKWMEQRGEWITATDALVCYKSALSPTAEELHGSGLRAPFCTHEYVHCKPARQAEYLELLEEMWWRRVAEPAGRSIIGLYWSPWKNTRAINIWGQGETWEECNPMGKGAVWENDVNMKIWQTIGQQIRTDWDDRFMVPAPFSPIR
jgi:hypothetical protein